MPIKPMMLEFGWKIDGMPCRAVVVNHLQSANHREGDWARLTIPPNEFPMQHRVIVPVFKYYSYDTLEVRDRFRRIAKERWYGVKIPGLTDETAIINEYQCIKEWRTSDPSLYDMISLIRQNENISGEVIACIVSGQGFSYQTVRVVVPSIYFESEADAVVAKLIMDEHPSFKVRCLTK